jgi:hypothetical protein
MDQKEKFETFEELFSYADLFSAIPEEIKNKTHREFLCSYFETTFVFWLREEKKISIENNDEYKNLLTKSNWLEFIEHYILEKGKMRASFELEKETWKYNNASNNEVKNTSFIIFLKGLEFNYPLKYSPIESYYQWQENLLNFKNEVLVNLIHIEEDARKPYINHLKFLLNEQLKHCQTTKQELDLIYAKYETSEENLLKNSSNKNLLQVAINSVPAKYRETFEESFNPDTENIQHTFYNFHYGKIIFSAIDFLNQQAMKYGSIQKEEKPSPSPKTKPSALSFKYINLVTGSQNITDLMNSLKRSALIHQDTLLANFRSVFSAKEIEQKIIWTGNLSELVHFIKTLHNIAKKVEDTKQRQWEITINCFQMADDTELTRAKLKRQQEPASKLIIEKAIQIL